VREVPAAFERANGYPIPVRAAPRRPGDVADIRADAAPARDMLGWVVLHSLEEACRDAMRWRRWWSRHLAPGAGAG
jgi:UDP-glucose 4-epimerase